MGFFKMDNSWYRTHDMFLRKGCLVTNYIIEKIDKDVTYGQSIRRLCRYMTVDPLAKKSVDLKGNTVLQEDLQDSLLVSTKEGYHDTEAMTTEINQCLFNESFDQEMKAVEQCYIFIHNYRNRPLSNDEGEIYVRIDVIIPNKYDTINDFDSEMTIKRGSAICFLVDDMLNHRTIEDKKYSKFTGDIKFELVDNGSLRLTKTSDGVVYSLVYALKTARGEIFNGNL